MSRIIGTDAALAASAVAAVVMSGLALGGFSPRSTATAAAPEVRPSGTSAPATPSSSAPSSPKPAAKLATLPADKVASLVVLGDGSSNETGEWVNELGTLFGKTRSTQVRRINQADGASYNDPIHYGTADPRLDIWNASATPAVALDDTNVTKLIPNTPSLVLISQGRDASAESTKQLDAALKAIQEAYPKAPVAVVLQPERTDGSRASELAAIRSWAGEQGLATIDVAKAFSTADRPSEYQLTDGQFTAGGHALWANTVYKAISAS